MNSTQYMALRILVSAQNSASGVFSQIGNGLQNMLFGFRNLGEAGTIGFDAIKLGAIQAGTALWQLSAVLAVVGAAIALYIGVKVVQAATAYQTAMTQLQNTVNATDVQMKGYATTIRTVSDTTGVAQTKLAEGMYQIVSANFAGADASRILTTATKAATIAGADQTKVTTGLVVTLNAFGLKASQVDTVSNQMFKTLSLGRGQMGDLAGALQTGGALVHHYGVSVTDMDASLATLSSGGMKTFGTSMTGLTQLLNVMDGKTDLITTRMHALGISFDETKFKSMDYQHQVAYLNAALANNKGQMVSILGSKQAATALGILGTQSQLLATNVQKLSNTQELAKEKADAWAKKQKDTAFQGKLLQTQVQNLLIDLGSQLLPIINKLVATIGPLIIQFVSWVIKSGVLQAAFGGLVAALTNTISFFQKNEVAMAALKATLIVLAVVIGVVMVVALYSMAAAAVTAMIPFLPLIAVILGVIVVVTLVILAIQHWGQIAHWLQGVWAGFTNWFMGAWGALGAWFQGILGQIGNFFIAKWNGIINGVKAAWNYIVNTIKVGGMLLIAAVFGPINAIVGFFQWLYNHNYYFQRLVDAIVNFFKAGFKWLIDQWNRFTGWLGGIWDGISKKASDVWGTITDTVKGKTTDAGNALHTGWTNTSNVLSAQWNNFAKFMGIAWDAVVKVLKVLWSKYIQPQLQSAWNSVVNFMNGWPKQAFQFGVNFVQGLINGLGSMAGNLGNAAKGLATTVASFLGFHSPTKEGPGKELDTWGPNLVKGFASGITKAKPTLQASLQGLMVGTGSTLSKGIGAGVGINGAGGGGGVTIVNNIYIEGRSKQTDKQLTDTMIKEISKEYRKGNNIVTSTSGGRS